jgi:hypothetical protein
MAQIATSMDARQQPPRQETALITGSEAIAVACKLADVDVITAYPIRPYDTVMQYESYASTDIQLSGSTPYGANTTFSTPGKVRRIIHHRWKKNMAGMLAAGHPTCKYVATVCMSYGVHAMNSVRKALSIGGPTFIHSLDPCPKGLPPE